MKQLILIFVLIVMFGCIHKTTSEQEKVNVNTKVNANNIVGYPQKVASTASYKITSELTSLVAEGDIDAYDKLFLAYLNVDDAGFLPYALLMANKYDYPMAYYHVYSCLTSLYREYYDNINSIRLSKLDDTTRAMALEYLKKGAEKGEDNSLFTLGCLYIEGKHLEKNTALGKQLKEKAWHR